MSQICVLKMKFKIKINSMTYSAITHIKRLCTSFFSLSCSWTDRRFKLKSSFAPKNLTIGAHKISTKNNS